MRNTIIFISIFTAVCTVYAEEDRHLAQAKALLFQHAVNYIAPEYLNQFIETVVTELKRAEHLLAYINDRCQIIVDHVVTEEGMSTFFVKTHEGVKSLIIGYD